MRRPADSAPLVLVVEDDRDIRDSLVDVLEHGGFRVLQTDNGAGALDLAYHHAPAVILLDMRLPVLDGWSFARLYRQLQPPHAKIVVMSATVDVERAAEEIGAAGALAKPFDVERLLALVQRLCGGGP